MREARDNRVRATSLEQQYWSILSSYISKKNVDTLKTFTYIVPIYKLPLVMLTLIEPAYVTYHERHTQICFRTRYQAHHWGIPELSPCFSRPLYICISAYVFTTLSGGQCICANSYHKNPKTIGKRGSNICLVVCMLIFGSLFDSVQVRYSVGCVLYCNL